MQLRNSTPSGLHFRRARKTLQFYAAEFLLEGAHKIPPTITPNILAYFICFVCDASMREREGGWG